MARILYAIHPAMKSNRAFSSNHVEWSRRAAAWLSGLVMLIAATTLPAAGLFGYRETAQPGMEIFGQWTAALERHLLQDVPEADCTSTRFNRCHLNDWLAFLERIRELPFDQQIRRINDYANHKPYVLDLDNYGLEDYWAVAREFLYNGGDCEDYAITKFFSLRWLGYDLDRLRIVILQDTNLRIPHAVLAVYVDDDILILDNQIVQVMSHRGIVHYVPVYAINESGWWIYTPAS